jgi:hypothetical protein
MDALLSRTAPAGSFSAAASAAVSQGLAAQASSDPFVLSSSFSPSSSRVPPTPSTSTARASSSSGTTTAPASSFAAPALGPLLTDEETRELLPPAYKLPPGYRVVRTTHPAPPATFGGLSGALSAATSESASKEAVAELTERIDVRTRMLRLFKLLMVSD